jgi:acetolactate synthase-1/2/3 large subunit
MLFQQNKMKLSNYIFSKLVSDGIDTVFLVTGGGAMHLNDAIGRTSGLKFVCNHNEQASSIAAEGYARVKNKPAIVNVTTGPGSINSLNGVHGAFTDSIPMIVISGQVKRETMMSTYNIDGLRQLGDQEVDITNMVKGITKYAVEITDPNSIKYHLEKAIYLSTSGRPGPVWISIPVDVQAAEVDIDNCEGFAPQVLTIHPQELDEDLFKIVDKISNAKRPVIIGSTGIRLANALSEFEEFATITGIPVVTAWAHDIIHHDHPNYVGKQGSIGNRAGNFAVQNSDLVIIIGSRMPIRQLSYNWENFARHAYKIHIDIDPAELQRPFLKADLPLVYDAKFILSSLIQYVRKEKNQFDFKEWLDWCIIRKNKYPVVQDHHKDPLRPINPYYFISTLQGLLSGNDVIVCGNATACIVPFQTSHIKKGQQLFSNSGSASMGYDLPAAIGAAIGAPSKRIICFAGDGSILMNLQELQTIKHNNLNIKIIVLDNNGYLSIKSTQQNFFGLAIGSAPENGVSFPDMERVGNSFNIPSYTLEEFDFKDELQKLINLEGPILINVKLDPLQMFEPKLSSKKLPDGKMISAPLEDMFPFLSQRELQSNMIVKTVKF